MIYRLFTALLAATLMSSPPTGDRHVDHDVAPGVPSAYRLFVPADWKQGDHWPLAVILHGGGGTEDSPFDRPPAFRTELEASATAHHLILVSPRGGKGWWGAEMLPPDAALTDHPGAYRLPPAGAITAPPPTLSPLSAEERRLARLDVEQAIDAVHSAYGTDPRRLFLMGNSMGSVGTFHLAQQDPKRWCAIAPSDGPVDPATYPFEKVSGLRQALFIHGDNDRTAPIESMRAMADGFAKVGVPVRFETVAGGGHSDSWQRSINLIFDTFSQADCGKLRIRARQRTA